MLQILEEAARSDTGLQRRANEDSFYARSPIYAVADGMGGASAGEVASKIATDAIADAATKGTGAEGLLKDAAVAANQRIWQFAGEDVNRSGMGTTLTALIVGDHDISIAHVGDSRAYLLREGKLKLLTQDHSLVEELKRQGTISEVEAENHPQRSIITRALGPAQKVDVDTHSHTVRNQDVYLICSDGLTTMVGDREIESVLNGSASLSDAAGKLIVAANENGGRDNITVVLVRLGDIRNGQDVPDDIDNTIVGVKSPLFEESADRGPENLHIGKHKRRAKSEAGSETMVFDAESAAKIRSEYLDEGAQNQKKKRHWKSWLITAAVALVVAALAVGAYIGTRQAYFIGTNDQGLITVYRGLPYELPVGIHLYSKEFVSASPTGKLSKLRRRRLLDHQLRSKSDALDLVRNLEHDQQ